MNLKTTLTLAALLVVFGIVWLTQSALRPGEPPAQPVDVLGADLTPEKIQKIEITHGEPRVVLQRSGSEWALPGKWPVRPVEAAQLVSQLTGLQSRFAAIPLGDPTGLKNFGLAPDQRPLTVKLTTEGGTTHELVFGEKPGESNRFSRETYVQIDGRPEVIRLGPGLIASLDRPQELYMKRQLFDSDRVPVESADSERAEKEERLVAKAVEVESTAGKYTIQREGDDWELRQPWRDRPDPDKLKSVLTVLPDVWAEKFLTKDKDWKEYGLDKPEETLRVTRPNGDTVTLLVGKESHTDRRVIAPPPAPPFGGAPPPQPKIIEETYHFAKLKDNDQLFEIKTDKLKDVAVAADAVRDAHLARFRTDDARRLEVHDGNLALVVVKDKDKNTWKIEGPQSTEAETSKVNELLDKLSGLQARDKDIIDNADLKKVGLGDKPATVKVTVEETKGTGEQKTTKTRELTFLLGKEDAATKKVPIQVSGWPRVNTVEADVLKLVQRPSLAYRSRKVLDFSTADLARIEVKRAKDTYALEQTKGTWRLAAPVQADIDTFKGSQLAGDLSRLEAVEFIDEAPKAEDLEKNYGLANPAVTVEMKFTDTKKSAQSLLVGKARPGKPEFYARLSSAPAVFTLKKETEEAIDKDSLSYRPLDLWQMMPEDISELRVRKEEPEYTVKRDGAAWKISGPFDASADPTQVQPIADELARLHADKYVTHVAQNLAEYGLDKPYLRVTLKSAEKKAPPPPGGQAEKEKDDKTKERVLLIGKTTDANAKTRFAKLGDAEAIFVIGDKAVAAVDHSALDLLDRKLLALDQDKVRGVRVTGAAGKFAIQKEKEDWKVTESPAPAFQADPISVEDMLRAFRSLRALRFAAYGDKVKLADYGLDKPASTVTLTVDGAAGAKPVEHTVLLGKTAANGNERFARIDNGPGVAVLGPATVNDLDRTYLDFVNRSVLKFDPEAASGIVRKAGAEVLEVVKSEKGWKIVKPADQAADSQTMRDLIDQLSGLRASRVAAFPATDVKAFGLDAPAAVVTVRLLDKGKQTEHLLEIGSIDEKGKDHGDRFARVAGSTTVVVLPGALAKQLTAPPLAFRDRGIATLPDPDKATQERGERKAVFTKGDLGWKMTEPIEADAEETDLKEWLKAITSLRADELVADKPADVKAYGLASPQVRWLFTAGDKKVTLLIGATDKDKGGRAYARIEGGDLVFLLDPALTTRALSEYRSRKVWSPAPPDAAQVERFTYARTEGPFTLEKVAGKWHLGGKPEVAVKSETVTDALDALAGLRAERYVTDKGTDLKAYGLAPDSADLLKLEVEAPTGKRSLHVGRQEGGSQRRYATIPGEGAPVFLISEADVKRLLRTVKDFTTAAP
jgi:hypothetical protein